MAADKRFEHTSPQSASTNFDEVYKIILIVLSMNYKVKASFTSKVDGRKDEKEKETGYWISDGLRKHFLVATDYSKSLQGLVSFV